MSSKLISVYNKLMGKEVMELKKKYRSVTVRTSLIEQIQDFISKNPDFITENPECESVAGFIQQATRGKIQQLKNVNQTLRIFDAELSDGSIPSYATWAVCSRRIYEKSIPEELALLLKNSKIKNIEEAGRTQPK